MNDTEKRLKVAKLIQSNITEYIETLQESGYSNYLERLAALIVKESTCLQSGEDFDEE